MFRFQPWELGRERGRDVTSTNEPGKGGGEVLRRLCEVSVAVVSVIRG